MITPTHRKHNPYHDYRSRCIYHITMVVSDRCQVFGRMADARDRAGGAEGGFARPVMTERELAESAWVELTPLGRDIWKAIQMIPVHEARKGNDVQILAACVMPEHIHFVLYIKEPMKDKLGIVIRGFKQGCNKALRRYLQGAGGAWRGAESAESAESAGHGMPALPNGDSTNGPTTALPNGDGANMPTTTPPNGDGANMPMAVSPSGGKAFSRPAVSGDAAFSRLADGEAAFARLAGGQEGAFARWLGRMASVRILREHALFAEDFDETRLRRRGQLRAMIDYVHNNPRHRWLRNHKPQWLLPVRGIMIAGRSYDAIGNVNLLALPRWQVHCRYRWEKYHDVEARRNHQNECVMKARRNYALVSPFVMDHEAEVRDFCLKEGHSIIQLQDNGFSDLQQCPGGLYDYCVNGQVLLLVPSEWPYVEKKGRCSRQECVTLNGYAEEIVGEG